MEHFEVAILGGGPAGLSASLTLSRVLRTHVLIDSGKYRNSPAQSMHTVLGNDGANPNEFRKLARAQIEKYACASFIFGEACNIERTRNGFQISTTDRSIVARKLILASGIEDVLPKVDGLADLWDRNLAHHCMFCHGYECRDKPLAVLANGPLTLHAVIGLGTLSQSITLLTNGSDDFAGKVPPSIKLIKTKIKGFEATSDDTGEITAKFGDSSSERYGGLFVIPGSKYSPFIEKFVTKENIGNNVTIPGQIMLSIGPDSLKISQGLFAAGDLITLRRTVPAAIESGMRAAAEAHFDLFNDGK